MNKEQKILYSREIRTLGETTVNKFSKLKIIVYGMRGVGIELVKNIIISGPSLITLYDKNLCSLQDLGSNFYLSEEDIGKRRDISVFEKVRKLNNYVKVNILGEKENPNNLDKLFLDSILNYDVIVITEILPKHILFEIDELCRNNNRAFIYGVLTGISGFIFSDFGKKHIIYDKNGRKCKTYYCKNIEKGQKGFVSVDTSLEYFDLFNGDYVIFKNVKGMEEINNTKPIKIFETTKNSFCIGDTTKYSKYISGGVIKQVKIPEECEYKSLKERFLTPFEEDKTFNIINYRKEGRNGFLFIIFLSLHEFYSKNNNQLPEINNTNHSKILIEIVTKNYSKFKDKNLYWFDDVQELDKNIISYISFWARCEISPLCSFLGGVLCQEIIKYTGKYHPIKFLFY